jgi:hypothetical protein
VPKIRYLSKKFNTASLALIGHANQIIADYTAQGYVLTLRQLYYQFVSRDLLANTQQNYKRLGSIVNDARLAGLIDWHAIEDRTRNLASLASWTGPDSIIASCAQQFRIDMWARQDYRPEVWIEKEALAGVFERVCNGLRVPYLSCRGYTSQSEMWGAGQRLLRYTKGNQTPIIFHFGDHDPSGIDMTRDIEDRLELFLGDTVQLKRLALNMDQVEEHEPPPNPAKTTDSRYAAYIASYGDESWELDALDPTILSGLVRDAIEQIIVDDVWAEDKATEEEHKRLLGWASNNWKRITEEERNGE